MEDGKGNDPLWESRRWLRETDLLRTRKEQGLIELPKSETRVTK